MAPEFDLAILTDDELSQIVEAGEDDVGYTPLQKASALLAARKSSVSKLRERADDGTWVFDFGVETIGRINSVIKGE